MRDDRAQHADGGGGNSDDESQCQHDRPEPAAGNEVAPALPQVAQHACLSHRWQVREAHACTQGGGGREGRGVYCQAQPGPATPTRTPPRADPPIWLAPRPMRSMALAAARWSAGTVWGNSPASAGK